MSPVTCWVEQELEDVSFGVDRSLEVPPNGSCSSKRSCKFHELRERPGSIWSGF